MDDSLVIVDDHPLFREVAAQRFEADGIRVLGVAADGLSGLAAVASLRPTIVLVDVHLPDIDGFAVARRLAEWDDPPLVVLTSSRSLESLPRRLAESRAAGFIAKEDLSGAAVRLLLGRQA